LSAYAYRDSNDKTKILFIISLAFFISLIGIGIVVPLLAVFADTMGASGLWIGAVFSAFAFSRTVCMPYFGKLSDRTSKKKIMTLGLFGYCIISLGYLFVDDVTALICIRILHGISSAMVAPVAMAYLGEVAEKGEEGGYMAKFQATTLFGFGAGPLFGGFIYDLFGFDAAFLALSGFSAVACIILIIFLPDIRTAELTDNTIKTGNKEEQVKTTWVTLLSHPMMAGICSISLLIEMGFVSLLSFLPLHIATISTTRMGSDSGLVISVMVFLSGFLQMFFGSVVSDRPGSEWFVCIGSFICGGALICIELTNTMPLIFLVAIGMAVGMFFVYPAVNALLVIIGRIYEMGQTMGAYNALRGAGDIVGPILAGIIADTAGLGVMFGVMGIFAAAGGVLFLLLIIGSKNSIRSNCSLK